MINDFLVRANSGKNELHICLDGYFMKSELTLALQLAKEEIKKLRPGFKVYMDSSNLKNEDLISGPNFKRVKHLFLALGGSSVNFLSDKLMSSDGIPDTVGFYPYENAWFLV